MFKRLEVVVGLVKKLLPVSLRTSKIPYPVCVSLGFPTFLIENSKVVVGQQIEIRSWKSIQRVLKFFLENNSYFYQPMFLRADIFESNKAVHTTYNHKN